MNADSEKRVGETAPTGEETGSGSEPIQKSESLETPVENEKNNTDLLPEHQTNDADKILSKEVDLNDSKNSQQGEGKTMETSIEDGGEIAADSSEQQECDVGDSAKLDPAQSAEKESQKKSSNDPYAYVDRGDFTSEKFKIEIRGLPKFYGYGELKRFLNDKLKLSSHKVKPTRKKSPWVFVCFKNEEDRQAAIKTLNRLTWKGKMLTASTAKPAPDPLVKKRKLEYESGNVEKKPRISDDERLKNSTTPYWNLSYEEQLKRKYDYVKGIMCNLADLITSVNPMLTVWIRRQKAKYNGMACNMLDIRKSPNCDGYRNKCEFTIGINEETKQRMVGFRLGSYVQGHVGVGPIDSLKHIPQRMKETVKVFEKFVQGSSKEPYNPETHMGHWRLLTLRLTTLEELMVVVVVNSKGVSQAELTSAKEEVKDFFENGEGKALEVNSLYFQAVGKREAGKEPPMEHVLGATHITESLLGLKFRISPEAFFQVNTPGASVLYSSVGEMIDLSPSTTIVDVCCGTGTIGLSLAKKCGQVLGLEVVAPAIEDAKVNAAVNSITNCEFFTGRAEEILSSVLSRAKGKSVYAIVDPPRSGLQQKGIIALRSAEVVEKIVYVSCDPNAALKNFVDLARQTSKTYHGFPLVPICAVPVDMFPHTAHCEVIILFHRVNPVNLPKSMPAKKNDVALLSHSLAESPSNQPKPDEPAQKEVKGEASKEKPISSESSNTNNRKKNTFPSSDGQQGKKFKKMSGGSGRMGRFTQTGQRFPSKPGGKQGLVPKGNVLNSSHANTVERHRGRKRAFEQDKPSKSVGQIWRQKSPQPWLSNDKKSRWKNDEPVAMWKEGRPPTHLHKVRMLSEDEYVMPAGRRSNWKEEEALERERRAWGGSSQLETKWHGIESRRREDVLPVEEMGRRREGWVRGVRDETSVGPKRWRDERVEVVDEGRKLSREVEQLLMERRGGRDEGGYSQFARDNKDEWPQCSHFRSAEGHVTNEPMWQDRLIVRDMEDSRIGIRRSDPERSPVRERQISPWDERRVRREELEERVDRGESFQEINERRQVRDGSLDHRWGDGGLAKRSENLDDKDSYVMRRKLCDSNVERDRPGFSLMGGECTLRKSSESLGRGDEQSLFDIRQERRMEMKGVSFDNQRPNTMLMERETIAPRHAEQMEQSSYRLQTYRDVRQSPPVDYIDKIPTSVHERSRISPERLKDRIDVGSSYRRSGPESYRRPGDISPPCLLKNERMVPNPYMNSKERMNTYEKKYEHSLPRQNYNSVDEGNIAQSKMAMNNRPIVFDDEYGIKVHEPRRGSATPEIFLTGGKSQMYPGDRGDRFTSHDECTLKNIMVQKETLSQIKPWGGHPSVMTKSSSPARKIESNIDMYTHGRTLDGGGGSWTRDQGREEMVEWRETEKVPPSRGYYSGEEANISHTLPSGINYQMPDRYDKRNSRVAPASLGREISTVSPQSVEKSFSFSLARAAIVQNVYSSDGANRVSTMSVSSVYPRKAPDQYPMSRNLMAPSSASLDPVDQMNRKSFGQSVYGHNRSTFDNEPVQGSLKLPSLNYKQPIPALCEISTTSYGQGFTSAVSNSTPTAGVGLQFSTGGINPWEQVHHQRW